MVTLQFLSLGDRFPADRVSFESSSADEVIIRLRGEYDCSTVALLSDVLVELMVLDNTKVVVDVREVTFMSSATVLLFDRAAAFLARRSRRLVLRSPSSFGRRVLEGCDAGYLIEVPAELTGCTSVTIGDGSSPNVGHGPGATPFPISA